MSDDRLVRIFREVARPVEPDARFADRLFERLLIDVDLGTKSSPNATSAVVWTRRRVEQQTRRASLGWLAAAIAVLLALAGVVAATGAVARSPERLVSDSQRLYADPPPFD